MAAVSFSHIFIAVVSFIAGAMVFGRRKERDQHLKTPLVSTQGRSKAVSNPGSGAIRIFHTIFLAGWLIGWTVGITVALGAFLSTLKEPGFPTVFLGGWLLAASAGWVFAVRTLIALLRGEDVDLRNGWTK